MKGYALAGEGVVRAEWIDSNGHMNIRWYVALFDDATGFIVSRLGLGAPASDMTLMAARVYVEHRKELFEGERWEVWSAVASIAPDSATIAHRLTAGGSIRATCDIRGEALSLARRTRGVLPASAVRAAEALRVPGLRDRFAGGH